MTAVNSSQLAIAARVISTVSDDCDTQAGPNIHFHDVRIRRAQENIGGKSFAVEGLHHVRMERELRVISDDRMFAQVIQGYPAFLCERMRWQREDNGMN